METIYKSEFTLLYQKSESSLSISINKDIFLTLKLFDAFAKL
jgi:hypothetical protein